MIQAAIYHMGWTRKVFNKDFFHSSAKHCAILRQSRNNKGGIICSIKDVAFHDVSVGVKCRRFGTYSKVSAELRLSYSRNVDKINTVICCYGRLIRLMMDKKMNKLYSRLSDVLKGSISIGKGILISLFMENMRAIIRDSHAKTTERIICGNGI